MTPEGKIVKEVKKVCADLGLRFIRNHRGPGAEVGWPDIIVLGQVGGHVAWIETKRPGEPLRPIQEERKREIESRGGWYLKIDELETTHAMLDSFRCYCAVEDEKPYA